MGRGEHSEPRDRNQRDADPVEHDPTPRLRLKALGGSIAALLFEKAGNRRSEIDQRPGDDRDGAGRRSDEHQVQRSLHGGRPHRGERTQREERGYRDPERRDVHAADRRAHERHKGFRRLAAPCGMHDQSFIHCRAEYQGRHRRVEPQTRRLERHVRLTS